MISKEMFEYLYGVYGCDYFIQVRSIRMENLDDKISNQTKQSSNLTQSTQASN